MVPGSSDPARLFADARGSVEVATKVGRAIGAVLAEQHTRIRAADVVHWLPEKPAWPESAAWIKERLPSVVNDGELRAGAEEVIEKYEAVPVSPADRALVHTDIGFHNLGIDPVSYAVYGVFDYEEAAWADRHHDFRYLLFDRDRNEMLEAAVSVYEPAVGVRIELDRVLLYNAACALSFLAYRAGTRPEERSCGRTLEEDLRWSRHAISRALEAASRRASRRP
jgi:hypothetical protein